MPISRECPSLHWFSQNSKMFNGTTWRIIYQISSYQPSNMETTGRFLFRPFRKVWISLRWFSCPWKLLHNTVKNCDTTLHENMTNGLVLIPIHRQPHRQTCNLYEVSFFTAYRRPKKELITKPVDGNRSNFLTCKLHLCFWYCHMLTVLLIPLYLDNRFCFSLQVQEKRQKEDPDLVELFADYAFQMDAPQ